MYFFPFGSKPKDFLGTTLLAENSSSVAPFLASLHALGAKRAARALFASAASWVPAYGVSAFPLQGAQKGTVGANVWHTYISMVNQLTSCKLNISLGTHNPGRKYLFCLVPIESDTVSRRYLCILYNITYIKEAGKGRSSHLS